MGSGDRAYRTLLGESKAIQEHQLSMIPIMQQQTEMQLEMRAKAFEQELKQTKKMNLLALQLQPEPLILAGELTGEVTETKPAISKLVYAGLAALAYFLLR